MALGLRNFYGKNRYWLDWFEVNQIVSALATGYGDHVLQAVLRHDMGAALGELGRYRDALEHLRIATRAAKLSGQPEVEVQALTMLSHLLERTGNTAEGIRSA